MKIKIKTFWPGIAGFLVATVLFCLPGDEFPQEDWLSKYYLDKWVHVGLFTFLVALWCLPLIPRINELQRLRNIFFWIALGFVGYGVAIEFIQGSFIPFRSFGIDDMAADALGCALGLLLANKQLKIQKIGGI